MSINEFWQSNLSAYLIRALYFEKKRQREIEDIDLLAWQINKYMQQNNIVVTPILSEESLEKLPEFPDTPVLLKKLKTQVKKPKQERKINTKPPTPEEIAQYEKDMQVLRQQQGGGFIG